MAQSQTGAASSAIIISADQPTIVGKVRCPERSEGMPTLKFRELYVLGDNPYHSHSLALLEDGTVVRFSCRDEEAEVRNGPKRLVMTVRDVEVVDERRKPKSMTEVTGS